MQQLADKKCTPCEGGVEPLDRATAEAMLTSLEPGWRLSADGGSIVRLFEFPVFSRTIAFTNAVAWVATAEGHHPELLVNYGTCRVRYLTTAISGLSENDFICAAKIDRLCEDNSV